MFDAIPVADVREGSTIRDSSIALASDRDLQRAEGSVRLVLSGSEHGTRIVDVFQQSPLRILFPRVCGSAIEEAVLVNTAGGIAGGDRLETEVTALSGASVTATSQAAERVYRALDEPAHVATRLKVDATARLAWLPHETIVFNGARLQRSTEIELSSGAELLALEWLVLGRAAHGEEMVAGQVTDFWRVRNHGRLIWADSFRVTAEVLPRLRCRALLGDFRAIGTLVYFGRDLEAYLHFMREQAASLSCRSAVTVVGDLLIARFGAEVAADLKAGLRAALTQFAQAHRSRAFRTPRMWSS